MIEDSGATRIHSFPFTVEIRASQPLQKNRDRRDFEPSIILWINKKLKLSIVSKHF